jgi:hypothetical protein
LGQTTISGKVIDCFNKTPISGIKIVLKGTTYGTYSNKDGTFSIKAPKSQKTLIFSHKKYKVKEFVKHNNEPISIELMPKNSNGINNTKSKNLFINTESSIRTRLFNSYSISLEYAYQQSNLYADKYQQNIDNELLSANFGSIFTLRQNIYPLIIDFSGFISYYTDNITDKKIKFHGSEISAGLNLPFIPNYLLHPEFSLGYQFSEFKNTDGSINTSQPFWKFGIKPITIIKNRICNIYIKGEYKQSLKSSNNYAFNQLSVGLGCNLHL